MEKSKSIKKFELIGKSGKLTKNYELTNKDFIEIK
jgi:hypothetical protein